MSTPTTTIRVSVRTRDRLAAQARQRGISLASLLTELAQASEHAAFFQAERDATRADAGIVTARDEDRDWNDAAADGIA